MQLKLETNLPVIFLTLLVIAIVVIGYLELKKIHERLKLLEYANKEKKEIRNDNEKVETEIVEEIKKDVSPVNENNNRVEEWQINNDKENIINTLNNKEEYSELINHLKKIGLPFYDKRINSNKIYDLMLSDKKTTNNKIIQAYHS